MHAPAQTLYDLLNMIDLIHSDAFSASSYDGIRATLNWRSSFLSGDNDPDESEGSGSIDGEFKVSLKNYSSEL